MASGGDKGEDQMNATSEAQQDTSAPGEASGKLKWFVVHTYSGHENKAKLSLQERIKQMNMDKSFGAVLIPTESVLEMVKGQRRTTTRKFYPGYMFVQMELSEATYHLVKNTPKITGFLGGTTPTPMAERDISNLNTLISEGAVKAKPRITFEQNENVRVIDGPFANFAGIVEEVKQEKQKVRVLVSIFGRATPVELDFAQVEKA